MIILDCEQGTDEWKLARSGIPTASSFDKIITPTGSASTQAEAYMNKCLAEWLTGSPAESFRGEWMERGIALEGDARSLYELIKGVEVQQVGLVYLDDDRLVSCSPDGLTDDGGFETKCPAPHTHVSYLLDGRMPNKYKPQVQGSMWITGRPHWDFMSFHPEMKPVLVRVHRDERYIKLLADEVMLFVDEMLKRRAKLKLLK